MTCTQISALNLVCSQFRDAEIASLQQRLAASEARVQQLEQALLADPEDGTTWENIAHTYIDLYEHVRGVVNRACRFLNRAVRIWRRLRDATLDDLRRARETIRDTRDILHEDYDSDSSTAP